MLYAICEFRNGVAVGFVIGPNGPWICYRKKEAEFLAQQLNATAEDGVSYHTKPIAK